MVTQVQHDSRGLLAPEVGLRRFRLTRYPPSGAAARFVDRYWMVSWDLDQPFTQRVLAHPVVNLVVQGGEATVTGVMDAVGSRTLTGRGSAAGVMFRPGGFRPFLAMPIQSIANVQIAAGRMIGGHAAEALVAAIATARSESDAAAAVDTVIARLAPLTPHACEEAIAIAERIAAEPSHVSVEAVAAEFGLTTRRLQRLFAEHVGASPKFVIRRYRLSQAAERVAHGESVNWAAIAADLGFSDQAHLTREFTAALGVSPAVYAVECASAA